ncbi:hypothetical protein B0T26DRAFT_671783 [Lasiosphaeria miniovina]|uniref:Uncharacterized protein n=1 Tax=Lasiosphaeria miniovina TaxID=1954250 RepID=A0AA40B3R8_9PEZI|nr:uncharacterized protein B0T26DRAFT_671783 [Lasiosphaeria miniovina]KAK0727065.1 hypothetical protein B0T26DRAFT_671783 [Lasiosphaeria miniovina]
MALIFAVWVGQTALGVLVPPHIMGNAAPVDPMAIYIPEPFTQLFVHRCKPVGLHIGLPLLSAETTTDKHIFDAGNSSVHADLDYLITAAFVATANVLTDTTLYPTTAEQQVRNFARGDESHQQSPPDGIGEFVVWSPDIITVSVPIIIVLPTFFVATIFFSFYMITDNNN